MGHNLLRLLRLMGHNLLRLLRLMDHDLLRLLRLTGHVLLRLLRLMDHDLLRLLRLTGHNLLRHSSLDGSFMTLGFLPIDDILFGVLGVHSRSSCTTELASSSISFLWRHVREFMGVGDLRPFTHGEGGCSSSGFGKKWLTRSKIFKDFFGPDFLDVFLLSDFLDP